MACPRCQGMRRTLVRQVARGDVRAAAMTARKAARLAALKIRPPKIARPK